MISGNNFLKYFIDLDQTSALSPMCEILESLIKNRLLESPKLNNVILFLKKKNPLWCTVIFISCRTIGAPSVQGSA